MKPCRHPKRLWRLASDRRYVECGDCGLRVAVIHILPTYGKRNVVSDELAIAGSLNALTKFRLPPW